MHICIAKEINKTLQLDEQTLILGTLAPDLSNLLHQNKSISHFLDNSHSEIPNIEDFLKKYQEDLTSTFTLGYYIHLLVDKYWHKNYINYYLNKYSKNPHQRQLTYAALKNLLYKDNTNINKYLIEKYEISFNIILDADEIETKITEIPLSSINILVEKVNFIINESKEEKNIPFNFNEIEIFIENTVRYILNDLAKNGFTQNNLNNDDLLT